MKAFVNANIFTKDKFLKGKALLVKGDLIYDICSEGEVPEESEKSDCHSGFLVPGFVDLQIYGAGKILFSQQTDLKSLDSIATQLVKTGTTAFFITLATNSFEVFNKAIEIAKENNHSAVKGVQLEGPYINPVKKGAHIPKYIKKPDYENLKDLLKKSEGILKMMTLAPEVCDRRSVKLLTDFGVLVSAGHSNATFEESIKGFDWGIKTITHLYNAMSPLHHRAPGLPGAAFLDQRTMASIIADGIHVDYKMIEIAKKLMGERLFYITDAVAECTEGPYKHIRKRDHYVLPNGILSGSALTLAKAVRNGVLHANINLEESVKMASEYPAGLAGFSREGKILKGYKANLNCLTKDLKLDFTVFNGEIVK